MMTLAHNMHEEREYRQAAIEIVSEIMAAGRQLRADLYQTGSSRRPDSPAPTVSTSVTSAPDRVVHNVPMRLRDRDKNFSGELGESWMELWTSTCKCAEPILCLQHKSFNTCKISYPGMRRGFTLIECMAMQPHPNKP